MKKALLIATLLSAGITAANAQQISQSEAQAIAKSFFGGPAFKNRPSVQPELAYTSIKEGKTHFYIFNDKTSDKGGFVIVGGDKLAKPILGYSENGSFDYNAIPENFKWWLSQYDDQISFAIKHPDLIEKVATGTRAGKTDIAALITTKWNQGEPFNNAIDQIPGKGKFVTGCVATAMAQVMKYYQYPTTGIGSHSYTPNVDYAGTGTHTFSVDFGSTAYDWNNMLDIYSGSYTDAQANAVANLMYSCGVSVDMEYGWNDSGANSTMVPKALIEYFGYDKSAYQAQRAYYSDEAWENLIYGELSAGRPVFYSGTSEHGGHAFICDGYRSSDELYDFNWGWGGYCDGHYRLTGQYALKPNGSGIGGAGDDAEYTQKQAALINVKPNAGGDYNYQIVNLEQYHLSTTTSTSDAVSNYNVDCSSGDVTLYALCSIYNISACPATLDFDILLKGKNTGEEVRYTVRTNSTLNICSYFSPAAQINTSIIEKDDVYEVIPVYRISGTSDWVICTNVEGQTVPTITITNTANRPTATGFVFSKAPYANNDNNIYDNDMIVYLPVINNSNETLAQARIYYKIMLDGGYYSSGWTGYSNCQSGFNATIQLSLNGLKSNLTKGNEYKIYFYADEGHNIVQNYPNITVRYCEDFGTYELTDAGWGTLILPFDAAVPAGITVYECSETNGNELVLTEATSIERNTPYIISGTATTIPFNGPRAPLGAYSKGILTGVMKSGTTMPAGSYILQNHEGNVGFYKLATSREATPYHVFINGSMITSSADMFNLNKPTSIEEIEDAEQVTPVSIYDLSGRKVETLQKGTNIIKMSDGSVRKVIVK